MRGATDFYNHCARLNFDAIDFTVVNIKTHAQKDEAVEKILASYDSRDKAEAAHA